MLRWNVAPHATDKGNSRRNTKIESAQRLQRNIVVFHVINQALATCITTRTYQDCEGMDISI
jgi:hypothetical protein